MSQYWRHIGAGVALAGATLVAPPASAAGVGAWHAYAHIDCFGCGTSMGTADIAFTGYTGAPIVNADATAALTVQEPSGVTCMITGTASGSVTGALNVSFSWTRLGIFGVYSTTGDIDGSGVALFIVTSPTGVACGGPVEALVIGGGGGT